VGNGSDHSKHADLSEIAAEMSLWTPTGEHSVGPHESDPPTDQNESFGTSDTGSAKRKLDPIADLSARIGLAVEQDRGLTDYDRDELVALRTSLDEQRHLRIPSLWLAGGGVALATALVLAVLFARPTDPDTPASPTTDTQATEEAVSLAGLDLARLDLRGADLPGANLTGTCLAGARLDGVDLTNASLEGADLQGASLVGAELEGVTGTFLYDATTVFPASEPIPETAVEAGPEQTTPCP
jgi:Pentapeptide repeats (8 copies)